MIRKSLSYIQGTFLFNLAFVFSVVSCAPNYESSQSQRNENDLADVIDIEAILSKKNIPDQNKADRLANEAERLVSPIGFMYAYEIFSEALKIYPGHDKARFYSALLKPLMNLKGILMRIKPLIFKSSGRDKKRYKSMVSNLAPGGLREFLLDGSKDIKVESDLQNFIHEQIKSIEDLRIFLSKNKDLILDLNYNLAKSDIIDHCSVVKTSEGVYEKSECDLLSVQNRKINRADIEILQHFVSGYQVYMILLTSYEATGLLQVSNLRSKNDRISEKNVFDLLYTIPEFGRLRSNNQLSRLRHLGADIFSGVKWAFRMQKFLCPLGRKGESFNRPGYLMNEGICISKSNKFETTAEEIFEIVEVALQGLPQSYTFDVLDEDGAIKTLAKSNVNPLRLIDQPQQSLKNIFPNAYDSCGQIVSLLDNSLGGVFPDNDFEEVIGPIRSVWLGKPKKEGVECNE